MRDFVYYSPTRFVFGQKMVDTTGAEMAAMGFNRVLLVYGKGNCPKACIGYLLVYLLYALAVGIVNSEV